MSDETEASVLGSLPNARPQRRSAKRAARSEQQAPEAATKDQAATKAQPAGKAQTASKAQTATKAQAASKKRQPKPTEPAPEQRVGHQETEATAGQDRCGACPTSLNDGVELLGTVAMAAVELAEIGVTVGVRALRIAVSRLPKP